MLFYKCVLCTDISVGMACVSCNMFSIEGFLGLDTLGNKLTPFCTTKAIKTFSEAKIKPPEGQQKMGLDFFDRHLLGCWFYFFIFSFFQCFCDMVTSS